MTEEDYNRIVDKVIEQVLLRIPEVLGNLMAKHAQMGKLNNQFYADHPEFKEHKQLVASAVEAVEGKNAMLDYAGILEKALPEIRKQIKLSEGLNISTIEKPKMDFRDSLSTEESGNGEI